MNILVVEDNADTADSLAVLLEHKGHSCDITLNGAAALSRPDSGERQRRRVGDRKLKDAISAVQLERRFFAPHEPVAGYAETGVNLRHHLSHVPR